MKIYLENENKRKIAYDILNIFLDHEEINFIRDEMLAEIRIKNDLVNISGRDFFYTSNQELKVILYDFLAEKTGYKSPWGTLTGSKPSKLLKNKSLEEIKNIYKLSDEKLGLLGKTYENQSRLDICLDDFSLYINIPFCPTRCDYCSYPTLIGAHHDKGTYVDYLIREIEGVNLLEKLDSIYIGGGTPSYLTDTQIEKILAGINKKFSYKEFTFEAGREDTLDGEKLEILKAGGVSRISLNPQTFNREVLKKLNRDINMDHFLDIYKQTKDLGLLVNMDFIVGLEGESADDFSKNFTILKDLLPDNITFHALAIKAGSKYNEKGKTGQREDSLKIAENVGEFTGKNGYEPYYLYRQKNIISNLENVGYQRNNTAQRYNVIINEEIGSIIGLGMNANSKMISGKKFRNPRNLRDYYQDFEKNLDAKNELIKEIRR
ncbi:coproporphyrinogen dehydrogenase HemZ [uncultured Anaerococcus sp.]|uniref:coproporphyrinogen dehydrogenase HemZ n=1 Tax=uncultured Anaerococcus sp. TaxID=293428 RepID=UPI00288BF91F|nr:coproporphyrinogen dehydrogenase HemZ [uncultured Anaerococcus sp.]